MKEIAIIDNTIDCLSIETFNYLVKQFNYKFTFHSSLRKLNINSDAIIILGSKSHVTENKQWQIDLADFIVDKLKDGIPVLGICFGHQLMAQKFGSVVDYRDSSKKVLSGVRDVSFNNINYKVGYSHAQEVKVLSNELELLASSSMCKVEIIKHKTLPFLGYQFHPEINQDFMNRNFDQSISNLVEVQKYGLFFLNLFFNLPTK